MKKTYLLLFCLFGFYQVQSASSQAAFGTAGVFATGAYSFIETGGAAWNTDFNKKHFGKMLVATVIASVIAAVGGAQQSSIPVGITAVAGSAACACSIVGTIQYWRAILKGLNRILDNVANESNIHEDGFWNAVRSWIVSEIMSVVYGTTAFVAFGIAAAMNEESASQH